MPYFIRTSASTFRATERVGGAWDVANQHIAPVFGLLVHAVELDRDHRRDDGLRIARIAFDILGPLPVDEFSIHVEVLRAGRSIELVQATLEYAGRPTVVLRAWLVTPADTTDVAGTTYAALPARETMEAWVGAELWPGGFIASIEAHRMPPQPGRGSAWLRTTVPLVADEASSAFARFVTLIDVANGIAVRANPEQVAFPNLDLTAHFFREPQGDWVGLDTTVSFGPDGRGLTESVLHDELGAVGTSSQILFLRPAN